MLKIYAPTAKIKPCWILAAPRTGSTYLVTLLNLSGLFDYRVAKQGDYGVGGSFEEYGTELYFEKHYHDNPPPYNKIHSEQWIRYFKNVDLEKKLPGIKYVRVRRKDFAQMAVSWYFAKITERWNVHRKEDLTKLQQTIVPYNFQEIKKWYIQSKQGYYAWDEYLENRPFLNFEYEEIVKDPLRCLNAVLRYIGYTGPPKTVDLKHEKMSLKIVHPLREKYKQRFVKELKHATP